VYGLSPQWLRKREQPLCIVLTPRWVYALGSGASLTLHLQRYHLHDMAFGGACAEPEEALQYSASFPY
jgi:hypothetical protein